ncbi:MAG: hypothetical protein ACMUEM_04275 [Flavobacteriales bacterium AspAUS03]
MDKITFSQEMIILGIDLETTVMRFALIKIIQKQTKLIIIDEFLFSKYTHQILKLKRIFEKPSR